MGDYKFHLLVVGESDNVVGGGVGGFKVVQPRIMLKDLGASTTMNTMFIFITFPPSPKTTRRLIGGSSRKSN